MKEKLQIIGKEIAAFFTSPIILKNVGLMIATVLGLLFITSFLMKTCTRHGESLQVDNYVGIELRDAIQHAERSKDRIIYLTVTRSTRVKIEMPKISGQDEFSRYKSLLALRDLKAEVRERVANRRYAPGTILKVFYGDKELSFSQIDKGYKLEKGSTVEFVVTEYGAQFTTMPSLACKRLEEVEALLKDANLVVGNIQPDVTVSDRPTAFV